MDIVGMTGLLMLISLAEAGPTSATAEAELSADIGVHELKAHVYRMASPEFLGRRGPGAARAARHLAEAFAHLGLPPAFGDSYYQSIPWLVGDGRRRPDSFVGRNVGALLPGSDPNLKDEWILLGAHYDHLGKEGDKLFPGADDNASGVAMLLEVAERLALSPEKPRRSVLFVAFDQEESGLLGSTHFAGHPPRDFQKLKAALTADMLGRSMANVMDEYVFALGSESSPRLCRLVKEVTPENGLKVGCLGADIIGTRSDYGPFRDRRVPFLFFSTGQHPDYHQPSDLPERLDYAKLRTISLWIAALTQRLADDPEPPTWEDTSVPNLDEVRTFLVLVTRVLEKPTLAGLPERQRGQLREVRERLQAILQRGAVTATERIWLVWSARWLLMTVF